MARRRGHIDYVILVSACALVLVGFAVLASASSDLGKLKNNDAYFYLKHQALYGLTIGIVGFALGYAIDYRKYKKIAPLMLLFSIAALVALFTPIGSSSGGAQRWIQAGPVTIQPSEILKITFIIYLAAWLSGNRANRNVSASEGLVPFLSVSGIIGIILLLQRSTSAAVIIMAGALAVYTVSGAKKRFVFSVIGLGIVALAGFVMLTPYRLGRVMTYVNPGRDEGGASYQIDQAFMTIGSGGMFGVGYGKSSSKAYLPERIGDSIFAVIADEFGFVGSLVLIFIFFAIVARSLISARRMRDSFGSLMLVGFATIIGTQAFVHMGANSGVIPLTGVPLPFISYGGTALAVFMAMIGIMLNISKNA